MCKNTFVVKSSANKLYEIEVISNEYPDDEVHIVVKFSVSLDAKEKISLILDNLRDPNIFDVLEYIKIYEPMNEAKYNQFLYPTDVLESEKPLDDKKPF